MRWISVAVLFLVATAQPAVGEPQWEHCEALKMSRVPQDSLRAAAIFLRNHYETWAADVPSGWADPRSNARWPTGFGGPECTVFANNQITVRASCEQVVDLLVDAPQWPDWYPNGSDVDLKGAAKLTAKARFGFTTFGSAQTCHVVEATNALVSWSCENTAGLGRIHHRWNCTEIGDGHAVVSTQECQNGLVIGLAKWFKPGGNTMKETMQRGHQVWLESLRCKLSERDFRLTPAAK
jgi:polyketide cyclase/dehydrase/lipid transport protein